jgi:hypothetical protein
VLALLGVVFEANTRFYVGNFKNKYKGKALKELCGQQQGR